MATVTSGELTGIIVGSMVGTLFLVTCVVSAVKAVKDRQSMKARIQEKQKAKAFASRLKKDGNLQSAAQGSALSIEDPDYFARDHLPNNHRVVAQSNTCSGRSAANGAYRDPRGTGAGHSQNKRFGEPNHERDSQNYNGAQGTNVGQWKGKQTSSDPLNVGFYRYKGDCSNGVENAAFEMKETSVSKSEQQRPSAS